MSGLEAAASLFGSEDPHSDPFASLGSESQHTDAAHGASDDLFAANRTSSPAPGFLEEPQTYSEPVEHHNTWPETNSYDPAAHNVYSSPEQNYGTQQSAQDYGIHQSTQNYGEQWQNYSENNYSENNPYAAPAYANGQAPQAYNSYTPSQYDSASAASVYHTNPATTQSAYTPYVPPAQTQTYTPAPAQSYNSYAPPVQPQRANSPQSYSPASQPSYYPASQSYSPSVPAAASPQTTYNSYTPPVQPNYGVPSYSSPQNSFGYQNTSGAAVPPPPAPKAPLNRPKVSNAYDPPFPTTTSKKSRHASSSSQSQYSSFSPPAQPSGLPRPPPGGAEQVHTHPPPSVSSSSPHNKPPIMSSGYSSASNSRNGSIDRLPNTNGVSATFSAYAPPTTNSHEPSAPAQNYAPPNNMARYDSYADMQPQNHNAPVGADPEPISLSEASGDFFTGHSSSSPQGEAANQMSPSKTYAAGVHPETQRSPPLNHQSPPMGPPKRASSAAAIRAPVRTSSPLAGGFDRPRSSNAVVRTSPDSNRHRAGSFDLYSPKVGQIPEELTSNLPNGGSVDLYGPTSQTTPQDHSVPSDPYAPNGTFTSGQSSYTSYSSTVDNTPRQPPPSSYVQSSPYTPPDNRMQSPPAMTSTAQRSPYDSKPHSGSVGPPPPPKRSTSNASILSTSGDLYAPSNHSRVQSHESDSETYTSRYNYPDTDQASAGPGPASSSSLGPQEVKAPTYTPYAPSPSLLGTNDPLGRAGARVPVFSFGFGGKFVTCFHGADKMNTGFDVALASRNSTGVDIRTLNKLIPNSALNLSSASFPGPLFSDPGSPTTAIGLVRPGAAAQTKSKKAHVLKYLEDRAAELSQGLGYLHSDTENQGQTESKIVLFKILKILVENDGKLSGTPAVDAAVREALVPQIATDANDNSGFTSVADLQGSGVGSTNPNETPISVTTLRPSTLDKIESFLLRGERRQAYHFALDQKLWSHAMIIASGIDKDAWQEVVNEFLKTELGSQSALTTTTPSTSGREGMRVVYSLFSGQGAKSVHQLVPKTSLSNPAAVLLAPMTVAATPLTPNFSVPMSAANIPAESLSKWTEIVAMMLSGSVTPETAATLTALGDQLAGNGWTEAAHVCYLLSPQTSTVAGSQHPSARIVLLGARNPHLFSNFMSDPDPIILSEIHEFALSLAPVAKGQEAFGGLPHLQAYRFIRAVCLAELGDVSIANRYCEAITVSMNRPSAYYTPVLLERLKGLSDRIVGVSQVDKAGSWMGSKLAKPSLDGFGGWLEGRFAKLVTGDLESPKTAEHEQKSEERGFVGPFSHYSTISSTTTSTSPSPQSSVLNLNAYAPPPQTGSASSLASSGPTERASSAMDNSRSRLVPPGPTPRVNSANASISTFAQAQAQSRSFGQALSNYASSPNDLPTPKPSIDLTEDEGQEVSWWGSGDAVTPTAANFVQLSGNALTPSSEGFVSLMDNQNYSVGSTSHTPSNNHHVEEEEDVEDLGFGNSKSKPKSEVDDANKPKESKSPPARPEINPVAGASSSGSWLSRLWKRDSTGPVKASLGEDSSFYYDAELKKWVNKKAGSDAAVNPATPPPPPARAQTTSPSVATGRPPSAGPPPPAVRPPSAGPPPPRASSAMENSSMKPPMRVRSNLVPSDEGGVGSAPSTPTGSRLAPPAPPPGRPKSQASKRNVRSRYVDVLSQEGGKA